MINKEYIHYISLHNFILMRIDNIAIRLDLTGMLSYFYSTSYYKMEKS